MKYKNKTEIHASTSPTATCSFSHFLWFSFLLAWALPTAGLLRWCKEIHFASYNLCPSLYGIARSNPTPRSSEKNSATSVGRGGIRSQPFNKKLSETTQMGKEANKTHHWLYVWCWHHKAHNTWIFSLMGKTGPHGNGASIPLTTGGWNTQLGKLSLRKTNWPWGTNSQLAEILTEKWIVLTSNKITNPY